MSDGGAAGTAAGIGEGGGGCGGGEDGNIGKDFGLGTGVVGFQVGKPDVGVSSRLGTQTQVQYACPLLSATHCGVKSLQPMGGIGLMGLIAH
jgi:hypothetical protein